MFGTGHSSHKNLAEHLLVAACTIHMFDQLAGINTQK
jgi:hypothetical protein